MKVDYSRFSWGGLHGKHAVAAWKGKTGTIPAFALGPRKTKKNLCRDGKKPVLRCDVDKEFRASLILILTVKGKGRQISS
jgi:hypothetical protein